MGAYVYAIKSKKPVVSQTINGNEILINYAPYIEKYSCWRDRETWEDKDSFNVKPLNGIVTRSEKYDENGELADLVMFDDPKKNPTYIGEDNVGVFHVYNRNRHVAWFDEPDYNSEGVVGVAKLMRQENVKLKKLKLLFTPRYGVWGKTLIKINNIHGTFEYPRFECNEWDEENKSWDRTYVDLITQDIRFLPVEKPENVKAY